MATAKHQAEPDEARQREIFLTLKNLRSLPKVALKARYENEEDLAELWIYHPEEHVPNFKMEWDASRKFYHVFILVARTDVMKTNAGYAIATIGNGLQASEFIGMYEFLRRRRSTQATEAAVP